MASNKVESFKSDILGILGKGTNNPFVDANNIVYERINPLGIVYGGRKTLSRT